MFSNGSLKANIFVIRVRPVIHYFATCTKIGKGLRSYLHKTLCFSLIYDLYP